MPRRRSASPMGGRMSPSRAPPRMQHRQPAPAPSRNLPARAPPGSPAQAGPPQSSGPGLFGQMAATAGGVAIGSAVGHMIGNSMSGGSGQTVEAAPPQSIQYQDVPQQQQQYQQYQGRVCEFEMKQFMECAQNQHDLSLCQAFNDSLRQCKLANGLQ